MHSKTFYLLLALIFGIIILLAIQVFKNAPEAPEKADEIVQFTPSSGLKIVSTNITIEPIGVTEGVTLKFNKPINKNSLDLKVTPQAAIFTRLDPSKTTLTIEPANAWSFDQIYTITILKSTLSEDNQTLDRDYEYTVKTKAYLGI